MVRRFRFKDEVFVLDRHFLIPSSLDAYFYSNLHAVVVGLSKFNGPHEFLEQNEMRVLGVDLEKLYQVLVALAGPPQPQFLQSPEELVCVDEQHLLLPRLGLYQHPLNAVLEHLLLQNL